MKTHPTLTDASGNRSIASNWTQTNVRMDRSIGGNFTVGGRGSNRSYHGKVASMVVTTLPRSSAMPDAAEAKMMMVDPKKWLEDYKIGNPYRPASQNYNNSNFTLNNYGSITGTHVWLMGDGNNDAYAKIRNQVFPSDQNYTPLNMISMVSNDIQTVSIPGLND